MTGERAWRAVTAPRRARLNGVESAGSVAYCAVDRGVLLERTGPAKWTAVFTAGPDGDGRNVFDLSLTDHGERVWFAGAAGTLGHYDRATGTVHIHDQPYDIDAAFRSVSANGPAGAETVHVADTDGDIVRGVMDGAELTVRSVSITGDGTALTEVVDNDRELFACDAAGTFYHTTEDQQIWKRRQLSETPVRAVSFNDANVYEVAEDGTVFEEVSLFGEGSRNPRSIDCGVDTLTEIDTDDRQTVVVDGDTWQLSISEKGGNFQSVETGFDETLYGAEVMADGTVIAVGEEGVLVEGVPA